MDLITGLARERHMATLFITHDLALAADYCDRIVVMHAGHAVECAPTKSAVRRAAPPLHRAADELDAGRAQHHRQPGAGARQPARPAAATTCRPAASPSAASAPASAAAASGRGSMAPRAHGGGLLASAARSRARCGSRPMSEALLQVESLHKRFAVSGRRGAMLHAVDDVSLHIGAGESVGLVGESGCGKSTLVRLLARLLDPSDGRIVFAGQELGEIRAERFARTPQRAAIQMVFQDPTDSLNPRFSAREAIAEPLRLLTGLSGDADRCARRRGGAAGRPAAGAAAALCAPAVRRAEGARGHRARAGRQAAAADPGRAHRGAGRVGAGGGAAAAGRAAPRAGPELPVRLARPERGAPADRPRGGDVPGQDRRGRPVRSRVPRAAAPLHAGAGLGHPGPGPAHQAQRARCPARSTRRRMCAASTAAARRARTAARARRRRCAAWARAKWPATLPHDAADEPFDRRPPRHRSAPTWPSRSMRS